MRGFSVAWHFVIAKTDVIRALKMMKTSQDIKIAKVYLYNRATFNVKGLVNNYRPCKCKHAMPVCKTIRSPEKCIKTFVNLIRFTLAYIKVCCNERSSS